MNPSRTPSVRFKGYEDEWEERKLSTESTITAGGDIDKSKLKEFGEYPIFANALTNDGIVGYYDSYYRVEAPAVTVTGRGDVGHAKARKVNFTPVVRLLAVKSNHDVDFLENAINNHKVLVESTGVPQLTAPQLGNYKIFFPTGEEQEKIGSFFKQLDDTIALHQRKLNLLNKQKKGFLQKMFPKNGEKIPEIRFAGFNDDWEERKLIEVADYRNGKAHEKDISEYGDYIVVNSKFVSTNGLVKKYSDEMIAPLSKNEIAFVLSDVPNGRAIARTFLINEDNKYSLNQRIAGITPHADTNSYFLHSLMNRNHYFLRFDDGVSQTNLSKKEVEKWVEFYPSYEEQQKIGAFFKHLDGTIALHQRKIDELKSMKKSMLQKMFV